jgi:hypothetical protein
MATPGRTHISWQTQAAQIRELITYIDYLEAKVSYLQSHYEHCDKRIARPPLADTNSPYLPPDAVDEGNYESDGTAIVISPAMSSPTADSYVSLSTIQPSGKRMECNPRWKRIVDQITRGWDKPGSWVEKRAAIGLDSVEQNKYALTAILGLKKDLPLHLGLEESQPFFSEGCISDATNILVTSARQYAMDSKASERSPGLITQVQIFRELVFASFCVVMEHQGLPIDTIDNLMRICVSNSGSANLYRLRRGALWVNRVISGTLIKKMGWGRASTEFFLLCRSASHATSHKRLD